MDGVSVGNEIKDGYKRTDGWVRANLNWLGEVSSYYRQRAEIERDYASKLRQLSAESFKKKAKQTSVLSVGDEPLVTPGSLECASMVAWNEVLTQAENIARQKDGLARDFESRVAADIARMQEGYEQLANRWKDVNEQLVKGRDECYGRVKALKKDYDDACAAMESQRAKSERNGKSEKLARRETKMGLAKNRYLVELSVANRLKDKYYYQDVPEILDGLQGLQEAKVSRLNSILLGAAVMERQANEKIGGFLQDEDAVITQNLPRLDSAMFVKHNAGSWREPQDFLFEPSPVWHDEDTMVVSGGALEELKERLNEASGKYEHFTTVCQDEKQAVAEMVESRNAILGDTMEEVKIKPKEDFAKFEALLGKSIFAWQQFAQDDTRRVVAEVEIEVIQTATEGQDMTIVRPVKEKKKHFSLFGGGKKNNETPVESVTTSIGHVTIDKGNTKSRVFSGIGRRLGLGSESIGGSSVDFSSSLTATASYAYSAKGDDEVTISAGEALVVVDEDDGSGWTEVRNQSGEQGLVPTSYITLKAAKKVGPKVAPRRGGHKIEYVQAMYDYEAQGDDELSIRKGDRIVVVAADDGSGWTEGEVGGKRGLFPTTYAK